MKLNRGVAPSTAYFFNPFQDCLPWSVIECAWQGSVNVPLTKSFYRYTPSLIHCDNVEECKYNEQIHCTFQFDNEHGLGNLERNTLKLAVQKTATLIYGGGR
jgi:hypothetical protein